MVSLVQCAVLFPAHPLRWSAVSQMTRPPAARQDIPSPLGPADPTVKWRPDKTPDKTPSGAWIGVSKEDPCANSLLTSPSTPASSLSPPSLRRLAPEVVYQLCSTNSGPRAIEREGYGKVPDYLKDKPKRKPPAEDSAGAAAVPARPLAVLEGRPESPLLSPPAHGSPARSPSRPGIDAPSWRPPKPAAGNPWRPLPFSTSQEVGGEAMRRGNPDSLPVDWPALSPPPLQVCPIADRAAPVDWADGPPLLRTNMLPSTVGGWDNHPENDGPASSDTPQRPPAGTTGGYGGYGYGGQSDASPYEFGAALDGRPRTTGGGGRPPGSPLKPIRVSKQHSLEGHRCPKPV